MLLAQSRIFKNTLSILLYRCRTRDLEDETKELKEKLTEVEDLLRRTEAQRQELERLNEFNKKEHSAALAAATTKVRSCSSFPCMGHIVCALL